PTRETRALPGQTRCMSANLAGALRLNESSCRTQSRAHNFASRANTRARCLQWQTSIHLRRHDEAQTRRRAGAVAGWKMGGVRCGRCRSRGQHQDFASVDCARARRKLSSLKPNDESRRTAPLFTGWKEIDLDVESDRSDANLDVRF